jgi:hypothetical protein
MREVTRPVSQSGEMPALQEKKNFISGVIGGKLHLKLLQLFIELHSNAFNIFVVRVTFI